MATAMALSLTTACGGSSDDAKEAKETKEAKPSSHSPSAPVSGAPDPGRELSKAELEKLALAQGDVKDVSIGPLPGAESGPGKEKAGDAACQPLAALVNGAPEPAASATVYRQITGQGDADSQAITEFLTVHKPQEASRVLAGLRAALKSCAGGFTTQGGDDGPAKYSEVKELPTAKAGDDSLAYQVTGQVDGDSVPLVFQVVRSGATVATFYAPNFMDEKPSEVPAALVTAQIEKLTKAR